MTHPNTTLCWLPLAAALFLGLAPPQCALGQDGAVDSPSESRESSGGNELLMLDNPLVITTAQTSLRVADSPAAVSVISEDEIRKSGLTNVPDLLRSLPGVDVMEPNNGMQSVVIRGFNYPFAANTLVMVNGKSIYQDIFGGTLWVQEPLLISQIKQIEVVRGPGSVLYGANAFGGVINIITKTPEELVKDGPGSSFFVTRGTDESTVAEAVGYGGQPGPNGFVYSIGGGYHGTNGIGDLRPGAVRDSSSIPILTVDATRYVRHGSIDLNAAFSGGKTDVVNPFIPLVDASNRTNRLAIDYKDDRSKLTISGRTYGASLSSMGGTSEETNTTEFNIQQQRDPSSRHRLIYGASYRLVHANSPLIDTISQSDHLSAVYGQDEYELNPASHLFVGVRVDTHSSYGTDVSPRISLVNHVKHDQTLRMSFSTAFRDPTILDSHYNTTIQFAGLPVHLAGNTGLKPQKVTSLELAYRKDLHDGYVEISAYHNSLTNVFNPIVTSYIQPPGYPFPIPSGVTEINGSSATADGFEIDSGFKLARNLQGRANYAYENALQGGQREELTPRNHLNLSIDSQPTSRFDANMGLHYVDKDFENALTSTRIDIAPYTDVDARLGYKFAADHQPCELSVAGTNVFNVPHLEFPNILFNGMPTAAAEPRRVWLEFSGSW